MCNQEKKKKERKERELNDYINQAPLRQRMKENAERYDQYNKIFGNNNGKSKDSNVYCGTSCNIF